MISNISNYLPTAYLPKLATPNQMLNNLTKVALPAIALVAASNARVADAGPIVYAICVAGCIALQPGNPVWPPICAILCVNGGLAPTP